MSRDTNVSKFNTAGSIDDGAVANLIDQFKELLDEGFFGNPGHDDLLTSMANSIYHKDETADVEELYEDSAAFLNEVLSECVTHFTTKIEEFTS